MANFWGRPYLVNFILGVATGLLQEFQFGMAWIQYSRLVGDVFGAQLMMEGLLAIFFESTSLGLWIFSCDRLPNKIHLATLRIASGGSVVSAHFNIAANSWMQHPVGVELVGGRPRMNDVWAARRPRTCGSRRAAASFAGWPRLPHRFGGERIVGRRTPAGGGCPYGSQPSG